MRFYLDSQFRAAKQYFLGNHLNASSVPSKPVAYYHIRYRVGNTFFDLHFSAAGIVSCAWWLCALRVWECRSVLFVCLLLSVVLSFFFLVRCQLTIRKDLAIAITTVLWNSRLQTVAGLRRRFSFRQRCYCYCCCDIITREKRFNQGKLEALTPRTAFHVLAIIGCLSFPCYCCSTAHYYVI